MQNPLHRTKRVVRPNMIYQLMDYGSYIRDWRFQPPLVMKMYCRRIITFLRYCLYLRRKADNEYPVLK